MAVRCPKCQAYTANEHAYSVVRCAACGEPIDARKHGGHDAHDAPKAPPPWAGWPTMNPAFQARHCPATMADLEKYAASSPLVKMHLDLWRKGGFLCLERMLVSLAVHLAAERLALLERVTAEAYAPSPLRGAYPAWAASRGKQPPADQPITVPAKEPDRA